MSRFRKLIGITDFDKMMQCEVCNNLLTSPVFFCKGGHNICSNCNGSYQEPPLKCPTCDNEFTQTRNLLAEELLTYSLEPTVSRGSSVSERSSGDEFTSRRPFNCPVFCCKTLVAMNTIENHLKFDHPGLRIHQIVDGK